MFDRNRLCVLFWMKVGGKLVVKLLNSGDRYGCVRLVLFV